jgi:mRNA-degrading endonuclease RelE of RelBE toxin-antitoxin system
VTEDGYELIVARPAARAIAETLPEPVAAAVIDFITGSLIENPRRVGRELRNELAGIHSARRGSYRVLYRIDESERTVTVLRIDHRGDVYRTT